MCQDVVTWCEQTWCSKRLCLPVILALVRLQINERWLFGKLFHFFHNFHIFIAVYLFSFLPWSPAKPWSLCLPHLLTFRWVQGNDASSTEESSLVLTLEQWPVVQVFFVQMWEPTTLLSIFVQVLVQPHQLFKHLLPAVQGLQLVCQIRDEFALLTDATPNSIELPHHLHHWVTLLCFHLCANFHSNPSFISGATSATSVPSSIVASTKFSTSFTVSA